MPTFISAPSLSDAVRRLQEASCEPRLADFLVLKRYRAISGRDVIPLSLRDENFVRAVHQLYACGATTFFNPFGTAVEEKRRGFRTAKIISNGTPDSVAQAHWSSILKRVGERPRKVEFQPYSGEELRAFLIGRGADLPRLADAAIWFYREANLEELAGYAETANVVRFLTDDFIRSIDLTAIDLVLFDESTISEVDVSSSPAQDYLPERPADIEDELTGDTSFGRVLPVKLSQFERSTALEELIAAIDKAGMYFEPWQVASYVTALRTKPFAIIAGVTGTGKSRLPRLVAQLTGGLSDTIPVRPDWTDSAEVLGFVGLDGEFHPGSVLRFAERAERDPSRFHACVLDEMNLARVEQYLAEILSRIEQRERQHEGGWATQPLVQAASSESASAWCTVRLPSNFAIVGTVNMDESAHGFSRKVLDRAFIIELSDVHLDKWRTAATVTPSAEWPAEAWWPCATSLSELSELSRDDELLIGAAVDVLQTVNRAMGEAQLQIGYRARDEIALFLLHAVEVQQAFRLSTGGAVDPFDLALQMKILPRIAGGSNAIRRVLLGLLGIAVMRKPLYDDSGANELVDLWTGEGRPAFMPEAVYPYTAARLTLMWERFVGDGFTSYWL